MFYSYLILIIFALFNLILILNFSKIKFFYSNIDKPDKVRKFHSKPVPLAGGQIIFLNIFFFWLILNLFESILIKEIFFQNLKSLNYFMAAASCIFLLGFIDDKFDIKANLKFFILTIIIVILLIIDDKLILYNINFSFYEKNFNLNNFSFFFSIFCFVVFMNAFNMFDGINLQSSFYSIFILLCLSFFFYNSLFIKILVITLAAFSYLNFKNKSFLGDSGSLLLAFIISYFFIKLYNFNYINYADQIVLYMLIPGLDLIRLFVIRILRKKNPLSSDRLHLHHLLLSKYSLKTTLIMILFTISLPIILDNTNLNKIYIILITIINYSFLIINSQKKN